MLDIPSLKRMSATCHDLRDASTSLLWERVTISVNNKDFQRWLLLRTLPEKIVFIVDPQRSRHVRHLTLRLAYTQQGIIRDTTSSSFLESLRGALVPLTQVTHFSIDVVDASDTDSIFEMLTGVGARDVVEAQSPVTDTLTSGESQSFWAEHPHIHTLNFLWRDATLWRKGSLLRCSQDLMSLKYAVSLYPIDFEIISTRSVLGVALVYSGVPVSPIIDALKLSAGPLRSIKIIYHRTGIRHHDVHLFDALSHFTSLEEIEISLSTNAISSGSEIASFKSLSRLPHLTILYWHQTQQDCLWIPTGESQGNTPGLEASLAYLLMNMTSDKFPSLSYAAFRHPVARMPALCRSRIASNGGTIWSDWQKTRESPFKVSKHLRYLQHLPPSI